MVKIALNGYGRIGRNLHRLLLNHPNLEVVAINARSTDTKMRAHLLKYDSLHGKLENKIESKEGEIIIDGKSIRSLAIKDARELPWKELGVDIVVECTGHARDYEVASRHLDAGAKKVLVSAPMKDDTPTFVLGVNEKDLKADYDVISNASCTTNCVAPILKLIHEKWGILGGSISSIHSFTHSQNLLDNSGRDLRRCRSAVQSVIPTTTGAIRATEQIIPELKGKIDGMAYRVPIATSSVADIVLHLEKETSEQELNHFFREIAKDPKYDKVIDVTEEELVSIDFKTNPHSSIIDLNLTKVTGGHYVKLIAWYDNEWGYVNRLKDMLELLSEKL